MRIVVLGGTGILGAHLVHSLLGNGNQLRLLYRDEKRKEKLIDFIRTHQKGEFLTEIEWFQGDLRNYEDIDLLLENSQQVYHCANKVSFDERDRKELLETNHLGTQNVVNIALKKKVEKFAFVSSIATLQADENESIINEESHWELSDTHSSYDTSKYLAELEVWRAAAEGLPMVIIQPGVILSAYDFQNSSGTIIPLYDRWFAFVFKGSIPFVDAQDVAERLVFLMNSSEVNQRFIAVGESIPYTQFVPLLRRIFHRNKGIYVSNTILSIVYGLYTLISFFLPFLPKYNRSIWKALGTDLRYDTSKIDKIYTKPFRSFPIQMTEYAKKYKEK